MAYRDDLYRYDNIIGYTGELHALPTVYFMSQELQLVGHITQQHDIEENIGREPVSTMKGYSYGNKPNTKGKVVLHEYYKNGEKHISRNPLVFVANDENGRPVAMKNIDKLYDTMHILSQAIYNYQDAKAVIDPQVNRRVVKLIKSAQRHFMKVSEIRTMGNLRDYSRVNFRARRNWKRSF